LTKQGRSSTNFSSAINQYPSHVILEYSGKFAVPFSWKCLATAYLH
jgi:hypothetical protein